MKSRAFHWFPVATDWIIGPSLKEDWGFYIPTSKPNFELVWQIQRERESDRDREKLRVYNR